VIVPEAERLVASFRARFAAESVAKRIPPHVTLLFPFVPAAQLDESVRTRAKAHFASFAPFGGALESVGRFDSHVWLGPEPRSRFVDLIVDTCARFPEQPPYGGVFDQPAPHLTIGAATADLGVDEIAEAAETELAAKLPLSFRVDAAWLLVEQEDGTWAAAERFPFAG
jgi:2'-5' RNA ligase